MLQKQDKKNKLSKIEIILITIISLTILSAIGIIYFLLNKNETQANNMAIYFFYLAAIDAIGFLLYLLFPRRKND